MMYPILCKVKYETLHLVFRHRALWIQVGFSLVVNWIIAPFLMVSESCHLPGEEHAITNGFFSLVCLGRSYQTKVNSAKA